MLLLLSLVTLADLTPSRLFLCVGVCLYHRETISKVDFSQRPFKLWTEGNESEKPYLAETVIVSTGATAKRLSLPGEDKYWQYGISACAVCDGIKAFVAFFLTLASSDLLCYDRRPPSLQEQAPGGYRRRRLRR